MERWNCIARLRDSQVVSEMVTAGGEGKDPGSYSVKGALDLKPPKFEHIFVAVITFPPFLLCKYF